MAELNVCIFCGKEPEKPRQYGYQIAPRRNKCYCIDHSCDNGLLVSVHGFSREEVVEKWNKIMPAADVAPVRHGKLISTGYDELYCEFGDCTVCGADNPTSNKFCGQCGAKMDREDD